MAKPTLEEYILSLDNKLLGHNDYQYYNEACKQEDLQLREWLTELRTRRRTCKQYAQRLKELGEDIMPNSSAVLTEVTNRHVFRDRQIANQLERKEENHE